MVPETHLKKCGSSPNSSFRGEGNEDPYKIRNDLKLIRFFLAELGGLGLLIC